MYRLEKLNFYSNLIISSKDRNQLKRHLFRCRIPGYWRTKIVVRKIWRIRGLVQVSSGPYLVMGTLKYLYVAMCKGESLATKWILSSMNKFNCLANWVADMNWFINHQCILIYPLIIWFYDSEPFRITGKIVTLATVMFFNGHSFLRNCWRSPFL